MHIPKVIPGLTPLRGIAALFVAIYHLPIAVPEPFGLTIFHRGYLWVDMFFILSGFVLMHAHGKDFREGLSAVSCRRFALARLARIYPLHITVLGACLLIEIARMIGQRQLGTAYQPFTGGASPQAFVASIFLVQAWGLFDYDVWNNPSWSISAEMAAYILFPAFGRLSTRHPIIWLSAVAVGAYGLALLGSGTRGLNVTHDYGVIRCAAEFAVGMALYAAYGRITPSPSIAGPLWLACVGVFLVLSQLGYPDAAAVAVFPPMILFASRAGGPIGAILNSRIVTYLGTVSYSIYLVHDPLFTASGRIVNRVIGDPTRLSGLGYFAALVGLLAAAIMAAAFTHKAIEVPGRKLILRLSKRRAVVEPDDADRRRSVGGRRERLRIGREALEDATLE